jgi:hypothetical protein
MNADPRFQPARRELEEWAARGLALQRPNGLLAYTLFGDWREGNLVRPPTQGPVAFDEHNRQLLDFKYETFLLEHDWASVFANSTVEGTPFTEMAVNFRTPFDHCCFEMVISGKHVCFVTSFENPNYRASAYVRTSHGWLQPPLKTDAFDILSRVVWAQFHAIGVALDAAIAEREVVRVPERRNRERLERGKPAFFDYHIVNLARQSRVAPLPHENADDEGRKVRLHFRRGHWRHLANHKTWIRWTLVGDPDLGFIEKHYRL